MTVTKVNVRASCGRRGSIATVLFAVGAVAVIAVVADGLTGCSRGTSAVGRPPLSSNSAPDTVAMPASRSALLAYVRSAPLVRVSEYEQAEPGPGQAMRATPGMAEFNTPSGNITCAMLDSTGPGSRANVVCSAQHSSFHIPPKPATCTNNWAGYFGFDAGGQVSVGACVGGPEFGPTTLALPYGSAIRLGGIGCRSENGFLACVDLTTSHGFAVNRDILKTY